MHVFLLALGLALFWAFWLLVWLGCTLQEYLAEILHPGEDRLPPIGSKGSEPW